MGAFVIDLTNRYSVLEDVMPERHFTAEMKQREGVVIAFPFPEKVAWMVAAFMTRYQRQFRRLLGNR
jgi:hypothetical protein